jgi:hypothetical protein
MSSLLHTYVVVDVTVLVRCYSSSLQVLQKHCEEALSALTKKCEEEKYKSHVKNKAQHEDIQSVTDVLKECWNSVHFFWYVLSNICYITMLSILCYTYLFYCKCNLFLLKLILLMKKLQYIITARTSFC